MLFKVWVLQVWDPQFGLRTLCILALVISVLAFVLKQISFISMIFSKICSLCFVYISLLELAGLELPWLECSFTPEIHPIFFSNVTDFQNLKLSCKFAVWNGDIKQEIIPSKFVHLEPIFQPNYFSPICTSYGPDETAGTGEIKGSHPHMSLIIWRNTYSMLTSSDKIWKHAGRTETSSFLGPLQVENNNNFVLEFWGQGAGERIFLQQPICFKPDMCRFQNLKQKKQKGRVSSFLISRGLL